MHPAARPAVSRRDIDGLILCAEHYGAPYDLLAGALGAQPARLRGITARWRRAGLAATGRLDDAPAELIEALITALDIQILYRPEQHQATIWAPSPTPPPPPPPPSPPSWTTPA